MKTVIIKKIYKSLCYLAFVFFTVNVSTLSSCKKLVDVSPPSNLLVTTNVFDKDATATAAQFAVYSTFNLQCFLYDSTTGISADELTNYSTSQNTVRLYRNILSAQNDGGINGFWATLYNLIYQENAILENSDGSKGMTQAGKKQLQGEAKFMRAFCFFELANMFGDIPLTISTDYQVNSALPRSGKDQVYQQIVDDLISSKSLLGASYVDANNAPTTGTRVRPNTWAVAALLAKAYFYWGKYDLAEQQAAAIIGNSATYSLVGDLTKVFKINSTEAIWQITPPTGQLYTTEASNFILTAIPGANNRYYAISPQLLAAFDSGDNRRNSWIGSYTQGANTYYYPYKYKDGLSSTTLTENTTVLRLAEQYLIRSEARAQQNNISGALTDLNIIRHRAGLGDYAGATDQASVIKAIIHERQVEMFTENDRWFDLKRSKTVDAVMAVVTPQKGGAIWNSYQQLYPLIVTDLQLNPNLKQNPGY